MNDKESKVNQTISGNGHQIAGRDVINESDHFQPAPNNPNLVTCPACTWYGVFRGADECPKCNYNFEKARLQQQQKTNDKMLYWLVGIFIASAYVFGIAQKLEKGFFETLIGLILLLGVLWWGGVLLWARAVTWLEERNQKQTQRPGNW